MRDFPFSLLGIALSAPRTHSFAVSVEQLKQALTTLSDAEQKEVSAFLFILRHRADPAFHATVEDRLSDADRSHWLTADEFEQRLDKK